MDAIERPSIRAALRLRNGIVLALLIFTPWAFACLYPPAQKTARALGLLLGVIGIFLNFARPTPPRRGRELFIEAATAVLFLYAFLATCKWTADYRASALAVLGYIGLDSLFWAVRQWTREDPTARRKILWTILLNAGAIAVVALANRLSGSKKVLWLYIPEVTSTFYVFGPFEYRGTASQYFNLLWPVAAGLYFQDRAAKTPPRVLFPVSLLVLLLACPLITSSRGGLLMTMIGLIVMATTFLLRGGEAGQLTRRLIFIGLGAGVLFGFFGVKPLQKRWRESHDIRKFLNLEGRLAQNENSWRIIADHPLWGVGPGAYESAYRQYGFRNVFKPDRDEPQEQATWDFFYAKAHNDWLQTLAEWGAPMSVAILVTLLAILLAPAPPEDFLLTVGIRTGILTLLLHGTFDYPLQNYAILTLLAVLLALAFPSVKANVPRRPEENDPPKTDFSGAS